MLNFENVKRNMYYINCVHIKPLWFHSASHGSMITVYTLCKHVFNFAELAKS